MEYAGKILLTRVTARLSISGAYEKIYQVVADVTLSYSRPLTLSSLSPAFPGQFYALPSRHTIDQKPTDIGQTGEGFIASKALNILGFSCFDRLKALSKHTEQTA